MSDLIKREDAIKAVENVSENYTKEGDREWHPHIDFITQALVEVPSAPSADRPQGEWQEKEIFGEYNDDVHHYVSEWQSARCSVCGKYHTTPYAYYFDEYNFCPYCGARMKGADDE